jgi:hypothetical protein
MDEHDAQCGAAVLSTPFGLSKPRALSNFDMIEVVALISILFFDIILGLVGRSGFHPAARKKMAALRRRRRNAI